MRALYRKYRPQSLDDVVGQEQVTKILQSSLKQNKLSHAYLFIGPRGCGKTSVARILAHEVNGFKYELEDNYIDIIEIDGASNRGIDNIRDLREKVLIAPTMGRYKVYIIDEVHMLTKEAFNALLKTLEEPPRHAIFIMATTDAYKVPVTITSRAQTFTFKLASHDVMFEYLKNIAQIEKINITDDALDIVVRRGGGSFRDSLSLLDQISTLSEDEITAEMVNAAIGLPQDEQIDHLLHEYVSGDVANIASALNELLSSGIKAETLAEEIIDKIIADPKPQLIGLLEKLPEVRSPFAEARLLTALVSHLKSSHGAVATPESKPAVSNKPAAKAKPPVSKQPISSVEFNWEDYLDKVKSKSDAVYSQLNKTKYEMIDGALHIYPGKRIIKNILTKANNKQILIQASGGVKITIHDENDSPDSAQKDATLEKISAIMGGEVRNDAGGNPFE